MSDDTPPVLVRPATPDDVGFIFNSWLKSYREAPAVQGTPNDMYYAGQHSVVERILQKPGCTALVACDPGEPGQIYGYVVTEFVGDGVIVHFCYVKFNLRRYGLARKLLESIMVPSVKWVVYSHRTRPVEQLARKLSGLGWKFNPFAV